MPLIAGQVGTHLEQADRDAHRDSGTPLSALVARDGPRVLCELLEDAREAVLALADGQEEPRGAK